MYDYFRIIINVKELSSARFKNLSLIDGFFYLKNLIYAAILKITKYEKDYFK